MLDTGALIAMDRGDRRMLALLRAAHEARASLSVTAPVIAQARRGGGRQARLSTFLKLPELDVVEFTTEDARAVGELARLSGHPDVVDVHLALLAGKRSQTILTSDPGDIERIDPRIETITV